MLTDVQIKPLRKALTESVLVTPIDEKYAQAIKRWNDAGQKQAGAILLAACTRDIATTVKFAVESYVDLAVRGGGHSHFSASSTDGGIVIDLSKMRRISFNEESMTVTVQGGALWADVDATLGERGLAAVGGTVNHTGVGGLTLGGGYGWLSGQYGLAIDNLRSAKLVLADSSVVTATETSHPDLFWAIRGGGGNFGIAMEFVFQAYEKNEDVFSVMANQTAKIWGMLFYTLDKLPQIIQFLNDWSEDQQPIESILFGLVTPPPLGNQLGVAVVPFYDGPESLARARFSKLVSIGPVLNDTSMLPYSKVNSLLLDGAKHGRRKSQKGTVWEPPLTMAGLDTVVREYSRMLEEYPETAGSAVLFQFDHPGKITSVPHDATAFANRGNYRLMMVEIQSASPSLDNLRLEYAKKIAEVVESWGRVQFKGEAGAKIYSNYASGDEDPREIFGSNLERLENIKGIYNPSNVFNKWFPITPKETQQSLV